VAAEKYRFPTFKPTWSTPMNMQKIFEKSENTSVMVAVAIFFVFHFGMLYLFEVVKL
jgi:hypothetical protein